MSGNFSDNGLDNLQTQDENLSPISINQALEGVEVEHKNDKFYQYKDMLSELREGEKFQSAYEEAELNTTVEISTAFRR